MAPAIKKVNDRHRLLAYLVASGYTNKQCAAALAKNGTPLHVQYIGQIKQLPEFKRLVREIQNEHMGGTVRSVLTRLARSAVPSIETMDTLRKYAEDDSVKLRAADRLYTAFEKATGLGVRVEENQGPLVQINLTTEEQSAFKNAMAEAKMGGSEVIDAEVTNPSPPPASTRSLPAPKVRVKTIKELMEELGPQEKYVESGAC